MTAPYRDSSSPGQWSAQEAWDVLRLAWGDPLCDRPATARTAAAIRLSDGLREIVSMLGQRARREWASSPMSPQDTTELMCHRDHTVLGGFSVLRTAASSNAVGRPVECYVRSSDFDEMVSSLGLVPSSVFSDVLIRSVDDDLWPFSRRDVCVPPPLAAVDVLDVIDTRIVYDWGAQRTSGRLLKSCGML